MKWFDKWFARKCQQAWSDAQPEPSQESYPIAIGSSKRTRTRADIIGSSARNFETRPMTFNVYPANGGWAVEYHYYNNETDTNTNRLHVVPAERDLGECLAKIVNYEILMK